MAKTPVDKFIADFKAMGWRSKPDPMERAIAIALKHPEYLGNLVEQVIDQVPEGGTFFDAALSFLPLPEWPGQVQHALAALEKNRANEAAAALIAYASQQCPTVLHPHLESLFALASNGQVYYRNWPWRESGLKNFFFLSSILTKGKRSAAEKIQAWACLLETRHPKGLLKAKRKSRSVALSANRRLDYFLHVGFEPIKGGFRRLYPNRVLHLTFPRSHLPAPSEPVWRRCHPTWQLKRGATTAFGGPAHGTCNACGGRLHHLLTLDPVPKGLGITRLARLQLVTCLSCLGWEEETLYYKHATGSNPLPIGHDGLMGSNGPFKKPEFPSGPLRKTNASLVAAARRWQWQDWALANGRENLNRLGGHPAWIQSAAYPECVQCKRRMPFLLQLDSELPTAAGGEWLWGSGGMCYCFWCDRCRISANLWQCT